jgi:hypothetical protein
MANRIREVDSRTAEHCHAQEDPSRRRSGHRPALRVRRTLLKGFFVPSRSTPARIFLRSPAEPAEACRGGMDLAHRAVGCTVSPIVVQRRAHVGRLVLQIGDTDAGQRRARSTRPKQTRPRRCVYPEPEGRSGARHRLGPRLVTQCESPQRPQRRLFCRFRGHRPLRQNPPCVALRDAA